MDTTRPPDRIRQDVTRSPGGVSTLFLNNCVGCHSGMDPMAQAFAYYNFSNGSNDHRLAHRPDRLHGRPGAAEVPHQQHQFPARLSTAGRRLGQSLAHRTEPGPGVGRDPDGSGQGAKSLGQELAAAQAFASCQVTRVFKYVCFRAPSSAADGTQVATMITSFQSNNYRCGRYSLRPQPIAWGIEHERHTHHWVASSSRRPWLGACGGGGAPTTPTRGGARTSRRTPTPGLRRPRPTSGFAVNFWNNVRVQNRCGQCHNATTPRKCRTSRAATM